MKLKVADLFCGTGGFSKGFEQTGEFDVVLGVDVREASTRTFAVNHPEALTICDDIRNVKVHKVADRIGLSPGQIDVVVAGPPCQGFSSIRPHRSINEDDPRNNLFEQLLVFVGFFKPRFVVFENVVGLLTHKQGSIFKTIVSSFEAEGYSVEFGVLNAVHFGVPQRRERVILLGRRGVAQPHLPTPTHRFVGRSMAKQQFVLPTPPLFSSDLRDAVTVEDAICDLPPISSGGANDLYLEDGSEYTKARRKSARRLTMHSSTAHTSRMLEIIKCSGANRWALPAGMTSSGFSSSYSRLSGQEPSITITVNFVHPASNRCIHPSQDRALTPREGARIQGFDDDFTFQGTRTEVVKQIGEAVPPLLGRAIADTLLRQF
jgi:DNA (cytosine-5)-methyltransferase 1